MTAVIPVHCSYQLSYQAKWELVTLWVRNIPKDGEDVKSIYEISYIGFTKEVSYELTVWQCVFC